MTADIHDQAHAYAVGALSPGESSEFAAHLETCAICRREVMDLREITAALSNSIATDPPPELRAAVLAEISRTPQETTPQEAAAGTQPSEHAVVPLRRRSTASWTTSLLAAAAVLAAVAFGGLWWQERQDADDATAQADQLTSLLSADDVQTVPGVSSGTGHPGTIVMSRDEGSAFLVPAELPGLPDDKVYEAWTISGSEAPVPAGTFTTSASETVVPLPAASFEADTMAITVEPDGGSDAPTSDPVATFALP